ncbi:MAG: phosphoglycerate dehydrogenase [Firmicutes bacterium]|nr:phosphoglycerate dehydrogenase [Bacillota bacterium]
MRIMVTDGIAEEGVGILRHEAEVDVCGPQKEDQLVERLGGYDAILVRSSTRIGARAIAAAPRLRVIGRAGAGVDNIDVEAATRAGVVVVNAAGGNSVAVAEHTIGLMLCLARRIPQAHMHVTSGKWERNRFMGTELRGKTLGLLGLGRVGSEVARRALALGMKVMAYDPAVSPERMESMGVVPGELSAILPAADFLSVHVPLTHDTEGLIGDEAIARMKKGACIINCARGGVVDEDALARALRDGRLAGAALDVLCSEPPHAGHPLLDLDNVVITPHLGASTREAQVSVAVETARTVLAVLRGELVSAAVNIPAPAPEDGQRLAPILPLAGALGSFAAQWSEGMISSVRVTWSGEVSHMDTRPLLSAVLKGLLRPLLQEHVNAVNAPLLARERGIKISEVRTEAGDGYPGSIDIGTVTSRGERSVAGSLSALGDPRLIRIDGHRVDTQLAEFMLVCPHVDQPGIIGQVGTILGEAGVNISGMQVARLTRGGEAIMVLGMDSPAPPDAVARVVKVKGVLSARPVYLER